ncbi:hypothetical protein OPV43_114 [Saccharomyces cerevisiae synthetic construct]|uniref:Putative uncharacterized protein YCR045W-A n=2 Tax=Saccharomyces cerevisiae TaxID=4932 RepID=YC045_YEAST|nr:RecName: Full=Putative uncharacterized protein YCR045W-A; Flags: Precursor [Saccharomyces cerevisiae S288C]AAL79249.1 unknown [Saccharomyces cerevisiae]AHV79310.1 hypothetical protein [synthetic construct]UZT75864.1 hypothetical protein OPV43_114 [Saccharomyces cerevisiae synthetic construct]CAY78252.1 EC1118_1C17_1310p [Saccharomyces cerevisiae EC1118]KZV12894.1 hypothetical protein WN66_00715 [Saccharomyces cerevisiae]
MAPSTAMLIMGLLKLPRLRLATHFLPCGRLTFVQCSTMNSRPLRTLLASPDPSLPKTLTSTRLTLFAAPYVLEPTSPATCVPWPFWSPNPSLVKSIPWMTLSSNSGWSAKIPVSMI